jgi:predicted enzyme related to lactoylglutathione lyase
LRNPCEFTDSRPLLPIELKEHSRGAMRKPFVHGVGGVLSTDIAVPDYERELDFYSKILTTGDTPFWRDDLMSNMGIPVIGLGVRTPEYNSLPLQWMPHFQVDDVAHSVACAIDMGGKELWHSKTDDGQSQWAVLSDQVGAAFGVIPVVPGDSGSTEQNGRIGWISWLSLAVPDALSSQAFYQRVVGWTATSIETFASEGGVVKFEMQMDNKTGVAEISQFSIEENYVPSVWLIHLPVGDLAESLRRVSDGGGEIVKEFAEAGYAVVRDPVGVYLALQAG